MAKTDKVNYDSLLNLEYGWITYEDREAKIGQDTAKGIPADVPVPFVGPIFNITTKDEAAEMFEAVGVDVFNALQNYAGDLKLRGRAVNSERARLTTDPFKKESKSVEELFGEAKAEQYRALRASGLSKPQALAKIQE